MAEQIEVAPENNISFTRALSLPLFALIFALILIYVGPPTDPSMANQIIDPDKLGRYRRQLGLRDIAIVFGLACLPGGLIGVMLGFVITQNFKLASASISLLRIGQWAPFVIWWVLVLLLFLPWSQSPNRYFFDWTLSIPAVALGVCFHFLRTRHLLLLNWRMSVTTSAGLACHRALFISIVLAISVWSENWVPFPVNYNAETYYTAAAVLALFLIVIDLIYRSGIQHSASLHREILLSDLDRGYEGSSRIALLLVFSLLTVWQVISLTGYIQVTPVGVIYEITNLLSGQEFWRDTWVSLRDIIAGIVFNVALVLTISATLLKNSRMNTLTLPILSLTYAIPMVMLPAWFPDLMSYRYAWYAISAACLSFYPLMDTAWALREQPLLCRFSLDADHALPYGFTATLYSQLMMATAGLGFATIVASATVQTEKAFAIFLITLSILFALSTTLRFLVNRFSPPRIINPLINDQKSPPIVRSIIIGAPS